MVCIVMVIGFTQRRRTVSEDAGGFEDSFSLNIDVATLRTSEKDHYISYRLREDQSTAVVESLFGGLSLADARFGVRDNLGDPLEEFSNLDPGESELLFLSIFIVDDLEVENEECFTLRMYFPYSSETREAQKTCNEGHDATDFFCQHTVCIEDNDGKP